MEPVLTTGKTTPGPRPLATLHSWLIALLLVLLTWAAFWPVHACGFINYDDPGYVTANRYVKEGLTLTGVAWAWSTVHTGYWHPLTWLSLMLDAQVMGPNPIGFHLTSLFIHSLNAALLYLVLRALTGSGWRSALVAAVFAVHPLRVESVAWISERKDVLSTCMGLLAIGAYVRYVRRPTLGRFLAVAGLLTLGLLAKPMLVTLPGLLLLLDFWPLGRLGRAGAMSSEQHAAPPRRFFGRPILEKVPLFVLVGVWGVVTFLAQRQVGGVEGLQDYPFSQRCAGALIAYWDYVQSTFWPTRLALPYLHPMHWPGTQVAAAATALAAITAVVLAQTRRRPWLLAGWLWFLGLLLPVIGLVQVGVQSQADRYTYLSGVGLLIMVAWSLPEATAMARRRAAVTATVALALLLGLSVLTWRQVGIWRDTITLFSHTLKVTGPNWVAYQQIGASLLAQGRLQAAAGAYAQSLTADPGNALVNVDMGRIFTQLGRPDQGIACYEAALRIDPACALAHFNLGLALDRRGQPELALGHYQWALRFHASYNMPHVNVGNAYARCGDLAGAALEFRQAIAEDAGNPEAHTLLGRALAGQGQVQPARDEFQRALALDPRNAGAMRNLAQLLNATGQPAEAASCLQQVVDWIPGNFEAQAELTELLARLGRRDQAIAHLRAAEALRPEDGQARRWIAQMENELDGKNPANARP